ncbi:AraC family transcriptional regulator [Flagellimonas sp. S3867]|uniref:AraC family transcriptional regulator n=1 Tax=Flagellimonas sp. S3867 TaxID=2768063 RepID=UPI001689CCA3|nr:AraC family transcriptional regulator [Flagellimonas sp. S3867]
MKPILEAINLQTDSSLKVECYDNSSYCKSTGWHIHPEFELVFVKNGDGCLNIGSRKMNYSNGTLVFLGGNIPHADFGNKDHEDNLEVVIQFRKEFLVEKLKVFPELSGIKDLIQKSKQVMVFDSTIKDSLWNYFKQFDSLDNQGKLINLLTILDHLSRYGKYVCLFDSYPVNKYKKNEIDRLEEIFEYVNYNYSKNISVAQISSQLGYTSNSFCRFFKKMTNRRFIDFVNEYRIEKAVEAFNESNSLIAEVMYNSGFNDPSYFTKQFKKYQSVTPSTYLKSKYGLSSV